MLCSQQKLLRLIPNIILNLTLEIYGKPSYGCGDDRKLLDIILNEKDTFLIGAFVAFLLC